MRPTLTMPALTKFADGTDRSGRGDLFPFLFITIACGAVSGFRASFPARRRRCWLNEGRLLIGYGGMLMGIFVAIWRWSPPAAIDPRLRSDE